MAVAAVDHLVHHVTILEVNGESWRRRVAVPVRWPDGWLRPFTVDYDKSPFRAHVQLGNKLCSRMKRSRGGLRRRQQNRNGDDMNDTRLSVFERTFKHIGSSKRPPRECRQPRSLAKNSGITRAVPVKKSARYLARLGHEASPEFVARVSRTSKLQSSASAGPSAQSSL